MEQAVAHCRQPPDDLVQLLRLCRELGAVDVGTAVGVEHVGDFVQRKPRALTKRDQR